MVSLFNYTFSAVEVSPIQLRRKRWSWPILNYYPSICRSTWYKLQKYQSRMPISG